MTPDELRTALNGPAPLDAAAAAALAARVRSATVALPETAVELAGGSSPAVTVQARLLVSRLDELAAGALLDTPAAASAQNEVWAVGAAVAAAVGLRARLAARLQPMLQDRRVLPVGPVDPRVEEPVRPRRVCDEAYTMLRELLNTGEGRTAFLMDRWAFLRLPESERDAEIARAAGGQPFARLLEDVGA